MAVYIGLDVHSKETVYVVQDESGKVMAQGKVATTAEGPCELVERLEAPEGTKIGLPARGTARGDGNPGNMGFSSPFPAVGGTCSWS